MPAKDDWDRFNSFADELGLEDGETDEEKFRTNFLNSAMERKGYKKNVITEWLEPEPEKKSSGSSDFFGARKERESGSKKNSQYE